MFPRMIILCALVLLKGFFGECSNNKARIVGGDPVDIVDFPYQVSIEHLGSHKCGGSIVSPKCIVTAAHCTKWLSAISLLLRFGSSHLSSGGQVVSVQSVHEHPSYNQSTIDYDIAVLRLHSGLPSYPGVGPIELSPSGTELQQGVSATVSGWGQRWENGPRSDELRAVVVPIVSARACQDAYSAGPRDVTERMLCAGLLGKGGKDACLGDDGGPLVADGKLVGVVSWGIGCATPKYPGVYSKISHPDIHQFVQQQIEAAQ